MKLSKADRRERRPREAFDGVKALSEINRNEVKKAELLIFQHQLYTIIQDAGFELSSISIPTLPKQNRNGMKKAELLIFQHHPKDPIKNPASAGLNYKLY